VYRLVSASDAAAIGRPFCEAYVFPADDSLRRQEEWRLVGIQLLVQSRLEDARFHFDAVRAVFRWHLRTTDLSATERATILGSLPSGVVSGAVTSRPLPVLPPDAKVTLSAIALVTSDDDCRDPHLLRVTAVNGRVYTTDPRLATIAQFMIPPVIATAGVVLIIGAAIYLLTWWFGRARRAA
jgi:hypothetical protein